MTKIVLKIDIEGGEFLFEKQIYISIYNPLRKNLVKLLSWNHKGFHMLMQFTILKHKGFPHGMAFHTEFHRPWSEMKRNPKLEVTIPFKANEKNIKDLID